MHLFVHPRKACVRKKKIEQLKTLVKKSLKKKVTLSDVCSV